MRDVNASQPSDIGFNDGDEYGGGYVLVSASSLDSLEAVEQLCARGANVYCSFKLVQSGGYRATWRGLITADTQDGPVTLPDHVRHQRGLAVRKRLWR